MQKNRFCFNVQIYNHYQNYRWQLHLNPPNLIFLIRYFFHLHFQCYPKSPPTLPPTLLRSCFTLVSQMNKRTCVQDTEFFFNTTKGWKLCLYLLLCDWLKMLHSGNKVVCSHKYGFYLQTVCDAVKCLAKLNIGTNM